MVPRSLLLLSIVTACVADPPPAARGVDAAVPDDLGGTVDAPREADLVATLVPDPEVAAMLTAVDPARIAADIDALVAFGTRNTCSATDSATHGIGAARAMLRLRFSALPGVEVRADTFTVSGCSGDAPHENVIAVLPGRTQPERLIIVGGHYDSIGSEEFTDLFDGGLPAPGANDSGSQTALLLEAARVMAGHAYDATVVFVAFDAEEQGLIGSRHFVRSLTEVFPGATVEAMLDCDIVGGDATANDAKALTRFRLYAPGTPRETSRIALEEPERAGSTDDTSPARGLLRYVGAWGAAYVPGMTMLPRLRQDRPGRSSDHVPFLDRAIPAVRFIDPREEHAHQHSPLDVTAYVTPAYTARLTRVLVATAASLARAPRPPGDFTAHREADGRVTLAWEAPAGEVDHYVVAARPATENLYRRRLVVPAARLGGTWGVTSLEVDDAGTFFVSVATVDAEGHESLFAYPELRCDESGCAVQDGSLEVTRSRQL